MEKLFDDKRSSSHSSKRSDTSIKNNCYRSAIPKGPYYMHDDRTSDRENSMPKACNEDHIWKHDRFQEERQAPKSTGELIATYGYNIRGDANLSEKLGDDGQKSHKSNEIDCEIKDNDIEENTKQKPNDSWSNIIEYQDAAVNRCQSKKTTQNPLLLKDITEMDKELQDCWTRSIQRETTSFSQNVQVKTPKRYSLMRHQPLVFKSVTEPNKCDKIESSPTRQTSCNSEMSKTNSPLRIPHQLDQKSAVNANINKSFQQLQLESHLPFKDQYQQQPLDFSAQRSSFPMPKPIIPIQKSSPKFIQQFPQQIPPNNYPNYSGIQQMMVHKRDPLRELQTSQHSVQQQFNWISSQQLVHDYSRMPATKPMVFQQAPQATTYHSYSSQQVAYREFHVPNVPPVQYSHLPTNNAYQMYHPVVPQVYVPNFNYYDSSMYSQKNEFPSAYHQRTPSPKYQHSQFQNPNRYVNQTLSQPVLQQELKFDQPVASSTPFHMSSSFEHPDILTDKSLQSLTVIYDICERIVTENKSL